MNGPLPSRSMPPAAPFLWAMLAATCGLLGLLAPTRGQEPAREPPTRIRRVFLPLEELTAARAGNRRVMRLDEFERLAASAQRPLAAPPATELVRAEYTATFTDDALRDGQFHFQIERTDPRPIALPLAPCTPALAEVRWSDRPAIWGTNPDGLSVVIVDRSAGELTGRWELSGRRGSRGQEFDLQLPRATLARIKLRVPAGLAVIPLTAAKIITAASDEATGEVVWTIEPATHAGCRIAIGPPLPEVARQPTSLVDQTLVYALRQDGLRLQADFNLEVLTTPVSSLEFQVEGDLQVYSVVYGSDTPLAWRSTEIEGGRRVTVDLPDPLSGPSRTVRLRAIGSIKTEQAWLLPQVRLANGRLGDALATVRIQAPLVAKSLRTTGMRQLGVDLGVPDEESFTYRRFSPEDTLEVILGQPESRLSARVFTDVTGTREAWTAVSQIDWTARGGNSFTLRCRIPPDWDVTEVRAEPLGTDLQTLDWTLETEPDGRRILKVDFLEGVSPGRPQRAVVHARRLPVPPDQATPVPAFIPLGVDAVEMLVSILAEATVRPVLEPGTGFDPVLPEDIPADWSALEFWKERLNRRNPTPLLLRMKDSQRPGNFYLQSLQTPVDVVSRISAVIDPARVQEAVTLEITPQHGRMERVLVYLNESGPSWSWTLGEVSGAPLEATRLPVARHAAWDLPLTGELYEVRLPAPQASAFQLQATRFRRISPDGQIALAFVPQAVSFQGRIVAESAPDQGVRWSAEDLEPRTPAAIPAPTEAPREANAALEEAAPAARRLAWDYNRPDQQLTFFTNEARPTAAPPAVLRLLVKTTLTLDEQQDDLSEATWELSESASAGFRWTLPRACRLEAVFADGVSIVPVPSEDAWQLPADRPPPRTVVVRYRQPHQMQQIFERRPIALPHTEWPVLQFEWQVATPPGVLVGETPPGLVAESPLTRPFGLRRLLGPLGRGPDKQVFNPLDPQAWRNLFRPSPAAPAASSATVIGPVAGWQTTRFRAAWPPETLQIELWNAEQLALVSWLAFLLPASIGTGLRWYRIPYRGLIGLLWMLACLGCAAVWPSHWAHLAGAGLAGGLIATLCPRHVARELPAPPPDQPLVPMGSTLSFMERPAIWWIAVITTIGVGATSFAADPPAAELRGLDDAAVLIPIDAAGTPAGPIPLAYVPLPLVERLQKQQPPLNRLPDWLLTTALYDGQIESAGARLTARFDVQVLATSPTTMIRLPLRDVNLGGPDACLVNGQPHPVFIDPAGNGLLIKLTGPAAPAEGTPAAAPAETPALVPEVLPNSAATGEKSDAAEPTGAASPIKAELPVDRPLLVATHRIELQLYQQVATVEPVSSLNWSVPTISDSRWQLAFSAPQQMVSAPGAAGVATRADNGLQASGELGPASELKLAWSSAGGTAELPLRLEATAVGLTDVQPEGGRLKQRVDYRVVRGPVDAVVWQLPAGAAVRSVTGPAVAAWHSLPAEDGSIQLQINLSPPQSGDFRVLADLILPGRISEMGLVRLIPPTIETTTPFGETRVLSSFLALRSTAEFQARLSADSALAAGLPVETFLEAWGREDQPPQLAFRLLGPADVQVELQPVTPVKTVRMQSLGRMDGHRLEWTVRAAVETNSSASFLHRMQIDPRLQIDSLTVQEDGADRLLRWTRSGDEVVVFLRDKTIGLQNVTVRGTMPLATPQELDLPTVGFVKAEVAENRLTLYQAADLAVELNGADVLERIESPAEPVTGDGDLLIGDFRLPADPPRLTVKTAANEPQLDCDLLTVLQSRESRWRMTTYLIFEVRRGHGSQFLIRVPSDLPQFDVAAAEARLLQEQDTSGGVKIQLAPLKLAQERFVVSISAAVSIPTGTPWKVPEIMPLNATLRESRLMIAPPDVITLVDESGAGQRAEPLPRAWHARLGTNVVLPPDAAAYVGAMNPWQVTLERPSQPARPGGALLLATDVRLDAQGEVAGRSRLWLLPTDRDRVEFSLPPGVTVRAFLIDGRTATPEAGPDNRVSIALPAPQFGHDLVLLWSAAAPKSRRWLPTMPLNVPQPLDLPVQRTLLRAVPVDDAEFRLRSGGVPVTRGEAILDRFEALLELLRVQAEEGRGAPDAAWQRLRQEVEQIAAQGQELQEAEIGTAGVQRWNAAEAVLAGLPAVDPAPLPPSPGDLFETRVEHEGLLLQSEAATAGVRIWILPTAALRGAVAAGAMLLLLLIAMLLRRWNAPAALERYPAAAWALMALVWWLALTPSWFGLLLAGVALWKLFIPAATPVTSPPAVVPPA